MISCAITCTVCYPISKLLMHEQLLQFVFLRCTQSLNKLKFELGILILEGGLTIIYFTFLECCKSEMPDDIIKFCIVIYDPKKCEQSLYLCKPNFGFLGSKWWHPHSDSNNIDTFYQHLPITRLGMALVAMCLAHDNRRENFYWVIQD